MRNLLILLLLSSGVRVSQSALDLQIRRFGQALVLQVRIIKASKDSLLHTMKPGASLDLLVSNTDRHSTGLHLASLASGYRLSMLMNNQKVS